jgi:hypothetical protein
LREFRANRYLAGEHGTAALAKAQSLPPKHPFGGSHTDDKVARLRAYLQPFTSALKHQGFVLVYIDAFAGSGNRTDVIPVLPLLDGENAEPQRVDVPGSARAAMRSSRRSIVST